MPVATTTGTEKTFGKEAVRIGVHEGPMSNATASAGAATANGGQGKITSESLTTAAGADYTLTLTNSVVAATDLVFANVALGTSNQGDPIVAGITPGAGSVVIIIRNAHASLALNGTIVIGYHVIKQQGATL